MKRISLLICTAFLICAPFSAQESDVQEAPSPKNIDTYVYKINQIGDQFIHLGINVNIPIQPDTDQLKVGGSGSLGYQRFVLNNLCVGGNVAFSYDKTIGSNVFYYVPVMGNVTYQFTRGKLEFPISLNIGGAFENYSDRFYFGLVVKPEIGAYWRYSADWSFGLHSGVYILPQWYEDTSDNYTGIITDIGVSVRYHF
jgi:hypothetical protein